MAWRACRTSMRRRQPRGIARCSSCAARWADRVVALRATCPPAWRSGDLRHANELVELIPRRTRRPFPRRVAAYPETHPQAEDALADLRHFKRKVDAGAHGAITQYFYNADAYFRSSTTRAASASTSRSCPDHADLNFTQLRRFSRRPAVRRSCAGSATAHGAFGDDAGAVREFATDLGPDAAGWSPGRTGPAFYTLNLAKPTLNVIAKMA